MCRLTDASRKHLEVFFFRSFHLSRTHTHTPLERNTDFAGFYRCSPKMDCLSATLSFLMHTHMKVPQSSFRSTEKVQTRQTTPIHGLCRLEWNGGRFLNLSFALDRSARAEATAENVTEIARNLVCVRAHRTNIALWLWLAMWACVRGRYQRKKRMQPSKARQQKANV